MAPADILWKNPKDIAWDIGALQESLGNSVYTVEVSNVRDKDVAVFGLGPTGLNAVAVSKALGAKQVIPIIHLSCWLGVNLSLRRATI